MTHLKRSRIPVTWPMSRKREKFAVTPSPGPHPKAGCMPLRLILRDILDYADSAREARSILSQGKVLVDKRSRKSSRFPVGLMDVIEIPGARQCFRAMVSTRGLGLEKIEESEASRKTCKITGKTTIKGGLQQLNLHDGRNIPVKKDAYKVGDSVRISLPDQKILKHYALEKGARGFITAGRNIGIWGRIKDIEERKHSLEKSTVTLDAGEKEIKTLRGYIFIAEGGRPRSEKPPGKAEKPEIKRKAAKAREKK
jgi:small subunit ribosomal protein S4e